MQVVIAEEEGPRAGWRGEVAWGDEGVWAVSVGEVATGGVPVNLALHDMQ